MPSVSAQLRKQRKARGETLETVARRAGTSAATLSRYENGWTRFEVATLRKLAAALGCDLRIELQPREPGRDTSPAQAVAHVRRLFWDRALRPGDLRRHPVWVVERVLEHGQLDDVRVLARAMGRDAFLAAVSRARFSSERTRGFWTQILALEGRSCTRAFCRSTAWPS